MRALTEPFPPPPFAGFEPAALDFLKTLAERQDRAWFAGHKADYERHVRAPMESLVAELAARLVATGLPFRGDPRRALFRPQRDTRFSNDKRPYKPHASAALTRDGAKQTQGVVYVHIDPAGSFTAAGFFRPDTTELHLMRTAIHADPADWTKLVKRLAKAGLTLARDDTLLRPPRGFDAAPDAIAEDIKLKSWIVRRDIAEPALGNDGLVDSIAEFARQATPLLQFGWRALGQSASLNGLPRS